MTTKHTDQNFCHYILIKKINHQTVYNVILLNTYTIKIGRDFVIAMLHLTQWYSCHIGRLVTMICCPIE